MRLSITVVRHSNFGPILHRFGDIADFLYLSMYLNYSYRNIPTYVITVPERHRRQTDRQTTHRGITALCVAPHGKKKLKYASTVREKRSTLHY